MKRITSIKNPEIKRFKKLQLKSKERKAQGLFVVEGAREILRAKTSGYHMESLLVHEAAGNIEEIVNSKLEKVNLFEIPSSLFERISIRSGNEKFLAIFKAKNHDLKKLKLLPNAIVLVMEAPEKPGNIGAVLRTATAANINAVIIANPKTDLYNPNIIRSSLGGLFSLTIAEEKSENVISYLKLNKVNIVATATAKDAIPYHRFDYPLPCAIIMGSEDKGLEPIWFEDSDSVVKIPMGNEIDSLNLSVSAGILIYEVLQKHNRIKI